MSICAIVGVVIGSGIFFQNEQVLQAVQGNLALGLVAWIVGGLIMLSMAYSFAVLSTRHEKVNGTVDFGEALVGKKYGYFLGWYMGMAYIPAIVAVMAWASARFTAELFGWNLNGGEMLLMAGFYLIAVYVMNVLANKLTQKFLVSATIIKLIPLILMAIVGTIVGLVNGNTAANIGNVVIEGSSANPFFLALVATAFAYDGWWVVSSLNSEIKNSKKVLPFAMVVGGIIIIVVYALYFVGIFSSSPLADLVREDAGVRSAFRGIFGGVGGTLLLVFIVVSCLGTLNGVMMASQRSMYSLSMRNRGPNPKLFVQVDKVTNNPHNSSAIGLLMAAVILVLVGGNGLGWFAGRNINIPVLSSVFFWLMLIPIFVCMIIKQKDLHWFNRFVAPSLAIVGALFMIVAAIYVHRVNVAIFAIAAAVIMGIGVLFIIIRNKNNDLPDESGESEKLLVEQDGDSGEALLG